MTTYKVWDNKQKEYVKDYDGNNREYDLLIEAQELKDDYLFDGNYPDDPHTVLQIQKFDNGKFVETIDY